MPETFRVLRELLSRIEKAGVVCDKLQTKIPAWAQKEAEVMAKVGGSGLYKDFKMNKGVKYMHQSNLKQMYLANTWKPTLSVIGADGIPKIEKAGNVIRKSTKVKLSFRTPPDYVPAKAFKILQEKLTKNVPHNCKVELSKPLLGSGWSMNVPSSHMSQAFQ